MDIYVSLITLGCAKNTADSEALKGILLSKNFKWTEELNKADIILINTCGFIRDAKEQSIETIFDVLTHKKQHQKVVVFGCLAQRYAKEIKNEIPEIDGIVGNDQLEFLPDYLNNLLNGKKILQVKKSIEFSREKFVVRDKIETNNYSYLKIADGCNNYCSYCVIPMVRGKYRSKLPEDIINEAKYLVDQGIKEIILIAQDVGLYGSDISLDINLSALLKDLCKIENLQWIRLLYCYPNHLTDELIYTIAEEEKICNYLDIPLQHLSDSILKKMGRKFFKEDTYNLVDKIRKIIPDIALRSTYIVGFPGETEEDFEILLKGLEDLKLTWSGFFTYSREEGTPAAIMPNQIPEEIKKLRFEKAKEIQDNITKEQLRKYINCKMHLIVEECVPDDPEWYLGRSYLQSPEVDGQVYVKLAKGNHIGKLITVKIIGTSNFDLIGEVVDESC